MNQRRPGRFSPKRVLEAVCKGIENGALNFTALTNGIDAPWKAPEYFLVVHAAKSTKRAAPEYDVWCESSVRAVGGLDGGKQRGRFIKELRKQARFDIAILNKRSAPKILVEIKRDVTSLADIKSDFRRLEHSIERKGSTVRAAVIAFLIRATADGRGRGKKTLEGRRKDLLDEARRKNDDLVTRMHPGRVHKQRTWSRIDERYRDYVWQAICLYAKRSGQH